MSKRRPSLLRPGYRLLEDPLAAGLVRGEVPGTPWRLKLVPAQTVGALSGGRPSRSGSTPATHGALVRLSPWLDWRSLLLDVQPDTLIRWHRQGWRPLVRETEPMDPNGGLGGDTALVFVLINKSAFSST